MLALLENMLPEPPKPTDAMRRTKTILDGIRNAPAIPLPRPFQKPGAPAAPVPVRPPPSWPTKR